MKFYHWFIGGRILHLVNLNTGENICGIEGWDSSGWRDEVRRYFGRKIPPTCASCEKGDTK